MLWRDLSTHNPSPLGAHSLTHLSFNLQPDPEKPQVIKILSIIPEEFILIFSRNPFPTFNHRAATCQLKQRQEEKGNRSRKFHSGVHKRQSHSNDNNNTITHAGLLQIIMRIPLQKQHNFFLFFLPPPSSPRPSLPLHKAYKGVAGFGVEPGTSPRGGQTQRPMTSYQSWMPERGEGGMKAERWMQ